MVSLRDSILPKVQSKGWGRGVGRSRTLMTQRVGNGAGLGASASLDALVLSCWCGEALVDSVVPLLSPPHHPHGTLVSVRVQSTRVCSG